MVRFTSSLSPSIPPFPLLHPTQSNKTTQIDLAPTSPHPHQLHQAHLILAHLLTTLHIPPSSLIITGDSAGAHLALSLLSHFTHPNPYLLPSPPSSLSSPPNPQTLSLKPGEKIKGLILLSPWLSFSTSHLSYTTNASKDYLSSTNLSAWSHSFLNNGTIPRDKYTEPSLADSEWWSSLPVEKVLVLVGEDEVLVDGAEEFVEVFRGEGGFEGEVRYEKVKGECHEQCLLDVQLKTSEGVGAKVLKGWVGEVF